MRLSTAWLARRAEDTEAERGEEVDVRIGCCDCERNEAAEDETLTLDQEIALRDAVLGRRGAR